MENGHWENWAEPLRVLLIEANEFLEQIDFAGYPRGGVRIEAPEIYLRKERLAGAFDSYIADTLVTNFLDSYIYASSVFEDMCGLVLEYIGSREHQMFLYNDDEFPQNEDDLIEDFCLFCANWESPIATASETYSARLKL